MQLELTNWADISTITGVIIAVIALIYTASQVRTSAMINRANFWLELRNMFAQHDDVHLHLRGGKWSKPNNGPVAAEEWAKVESYMGLFEHCKIMLDEKLIDLKTFQKIYQYRIKNILSNSVIVREKLIQRYGGWLDFLELVKILGLQRLLIKKGRGWLDSNEGRTWLDTEKGKKWLSTDIGNTWSDTVK